VISCWRIFNPKWPVEQAVSGAEAAKTGGRWNSVGNVMVYTSETLALATLEVLVHLDKKHILDSYQKVELQIPKELVLTAIEEDLPVDWDERCLDPVSQQVGDMWLEELQSLALRVPSVIIPEDNNILINPKHQDWDKVIVLEDTPFKLDKRLG